MNTEKSPVALITGASRGLGLALARELAHRGWTLIINARGARALEQAAQELGRESTVVAIPGDITDSGHRWALGRAAERLGGLDLVVNNAGILGPSPLPSLLDYPLDHFENVLRVNVVAQLGVLQALRPHLRAGARILNITSDAAIEGYEGWGGYGASKAALEQLSNVLAVENPSLYIYWVDPGDMRTQMHQEAFPGEDISDRPEPAESVPGILRLIESSAPSGRYRVQAIDLVSA